MYSHTEFASVLYQGEISQQVANHSAGVIVGNPLTISAIWSISVRVHHLQTGDRPFTVLLVRCLTDVQWVCDLGLKGESRGGKTSCNKESKKVDKKSKKCVIFNH